MISATFSSFLTAGYSLQVAECSRRLARVLHSLCQKMHFMFGSPIGYFLVQGCQGLKCHDTHKSTVPIQENFLGRIMGRSSQYSGVELLVVPAVRLLFEGHQRLTPSVSFQVVSSIYRQYAGYTCIHFFVWVPYLKIQMLGVLFGSHSGMRSRSSRIFHSQCT